MTRKKKSRKVGAFGPASSNNTKSDDMSQTRMPKKPKGNKAGSRQQLAEKKPANKKSSHRKDPRIGSKKPIQLVPTVSTEKPNAQAQVSKKVQPLAKVRVIDAQETVVDEIAAIENDQYLQELVEKNDDGIELSEAEFSYMTTKLERYQALTEDDAVENDDESSWSELGGLDYDDDDMDIH